MSYFATVMTFYIFERTATSSLATSVETLCTSERGLAVDNNWEFLVAASIPWAIFTALSNVRSDSANRRHCCVVHEYRKYTNYTIIPLL